MPPSLRAGNVGNVPSVSWGQQLCASAVPAPATIAARLMAIALIPASIFEQISFS
jgi:hypothetical protein